jgi:hypothetical protein
LVQQLGLSSERTPKEPSRWRSLLWADVSAMPGIKTAIDNARLGGLVVGILSLVLSLFGVLPPASAIDALLFIGLAVGIGRGSRVCAVAAVLLYLLGIVSLVLSGTLGFNLVVVIILVAVFVNGVRATFNLRKVKAEKEAVPTA